MSGTEGSQPKPAGPPPESHPDGPASVVEQSHAAPESSVPDSAAAAAAYPESSQPDSSRAPTAPASVPPTTPGPSARRTSGVLPAAGAAPTSSSRTATGASTPASRGTGPSGSSPRRASGVPGASTITAASAPSAGTASGPGSAPGSAGGPPGAPVRVNSTRASLSTPAASARRGSSSAFTGTGVFSDTPAPAAGAGADGAPGYRGLKELEADAAAWAEEVLKFRKAQAAQRSVPGQLEELQRLFAKLEGAHQQLGAEFTALTKEKDALRRQGKGLQRDLAALREDLQGMVASHEAEDAAREAQVVGLREERAAADAESAAARDTEAAARARAEERCAELERTLARERANWQAAADAAAANEAALQDRLAETESRVRASQAETAGERKDLRGARLELRDAAQHAAELQAELEAANSKVAELTRQVADLKPWEVKFHTLQSSADNDVAVAATRIGELEHERRCYRLILKHIVKTVFRNSLLLRAGLCTALARVSTLLLTATAEVDKLRSLAKPGALPKADSSPPAQMGPEPLGERFVPLSSPAWAKALQTAVGKRRGEIRKLLVSLKKVTLGSLVEAVDTEVARLTEPVEVLSRRLWSYYNTCVSLGQAAIQKTGDHLEADIMLEELQREHSQLLAELDETRAARDKERASKDAVQAKLAILEREAAQAARTRKQAQHVEALLREHSKLQSVQEHLALTKQRIKLLKDQQAEQLEQLSQLQHTSGGGHSASQLSLQQQQQQQPMGAGAPPLLGYDGHNHHSSTARLAAGPYAVPTGAGAPGGAPASAAGPSGSTGDLSASARFRHTSSGGAGRGPVPSPGHGSRGLPAGSAGVPVKGPLAPQYSALLAHTVDASLLGAHGHGQGGANRSQHASPNSPYRQVAGAGGTGGGGGGGGFVLPRVPSSQQQQQQPQQQQQQQSQQGESGKAEAPRSVGPAPHPVPLGAPSSIDVSSSTQEGGARGLGGAAGADAERGAETDSGRGVKPTPANADDAVPNSLPAIRGGRKHGGGGSARASIGDIDGNSLGDSYADGDGDYEDEDEDEDDEDDYDGRRQLAPSSVLAAGPSARGFDSALRASLSLVDALTTEQQQRHRARRRENEAAAGRALSDAKHMWSQDGQGPSHRDVAHERHREKERRRRARAAAEAQHDIQQQQQQHVQQQPSPQQQHAAESASIPAALQGRVSSSYLVPTASVNGSFSSSSAAQQSHRAVRRGNPYRVGAPAPARAGGAAAPRRGGSEGGVLTKHQLALVKAQEKLIFSQQQLQQQQHQQRA